jgi:DNA-binding XRE family transcriptional regulator
MAGAKTHTYDNHAGDVLADPTCVEYDPTDGKLGFVQQMIDLRLKRGLSQRQLAERVGTHQPSISRREAGRIGSLSFLHKFASALDACVDIRCVPRQPASARRARARSRAK